MANLSLLAFLASICIVLSDNVKVTALPVTTFTESIEPENQSTNSDENSSTTTTTLPPSTEDDYIDYPDYGDDYNEAGGNEDDGVNIVIVKPRTSTTTTTSTSTTTTTTTPKPRRRFVPRPRLRPFPFFGLLPLPFVKPLARFPGINLGPSLIPRIPIRLPLPGIG
nr:hypothetical transcript [Hymenolepis microstoma]